MHQRREEDEAGIQITIKNSCRAPEKLATFLPLGTSRTPDLKLIGFKLYVEKSMIHKLKPKVHGLSLKHTITFPRQAPFI